MAKWSATRRARFNYRKYEKPGRKFSDRERAAYWKKKYLALYRRHHGHASTHPGMRKGKR